MSFLEERKADASDFMLSQESIKEIGEAAEKEAKQERVKLSLKEKEKREFAQQLKQQQDKEFSQMQQKTQQDRLKYLLKQSEIFSHFILQNNKAKAL